MNELDIIHAEAAVRSKRSDYKSIFDPQADVRPDNLKQFWADPIIAKQAIEKLKLSGFGIVSITKITIGIVGSPEVFKQAFGVELIGTEDGHGATTYAVKTVKNGQSPYLIDVSQSEFNSLLAGVALVPDAQPLVSDEDQRATPTVELSQIPGLLNGWNNMAEMEIFKVRKWNRSLPSFVVAIDTGCDIEHEHFSSFTVKPKITVKNTPMLTEALRKKEEAWDRENALAKGKPWEPLPPPDLQILRNARDQNDIDGHGTSVVGHLMAVLQALPEVQIAMMKTYSPDRTSLWFPTWNSKGSPLVISCSWGNTSSLIDGGEHPLIQYRAYLVKIHEFIRNGAIVVFAAGNYSPGLLNEINMEAQFGGGISVGGVYKDQKGVLVASNGTHGFPAGYKMARTRATPHVCGISGPVLKPILNSPVPEPVEPTGWKLRNGSSFAAPQVAGVCAIIKAHCPFATPQEVKEILIRTATRIGDDGVTAQGFKLSEIRHRFGDDEFPTGLANLEKAMWTAVIYNLNRSRDEKATIKDAVAEAEKWVLPK